MDLALKRIEENKRTQAPYLDLSFCDLHYEIPPELSKFYWLRGIALGIPGSDSWDKPDWITPSYQRRGNKNKLTGKELNDVGLINLWEIYCYDIALETIEFLHPCYCLRKIVLDNNNLKTIHQIRAVNRVVYLSAANNQIKYSWPLREITSLQELYLRGNNIEDANELAKLINLKKLDLGDNKISDVTALSGLTNLEVLILHNNHITDINALKRLVNLNTLAIQNNKVKDIKFVNDLSRLKNLNVQGNQISQLNYELLQKFKTLETLYITRNPISNYSEEQLKKIERQVKKTGEGHNIANRIIYLCMILFGAIVGGIVSGGNAAGLILGGICGPAMCFFILALFNNPHPRYRK